MKFDLEYVASGCNYTRLPTPGAYQLPDNLRLLKEVFTSMQKIDGKDNHKFSLLYNAYCEKHFGPAFKTYYKDWIHSIHADSGGLQMVTLGVQNTPQLRQQVYENQAKSSDVAMSFDEIPIHIVGGRSARLDMSNRFFDPENFEAAATKTGQNLAEQLAYFDKMQSPTKPLFIAQGNDLHTYQQWTEIAMKQVPKSLIGNVGGIAMGGAALGTGMLEDVKKAFYYKQLPFESNHLHLLGVGSVSRLLPALVFAQNGVYNEGTWISYDSSTHSSGPEMGRYYLGEHTFIFGRSRDNRYDIIHADINRNFPGVFDIDVELFYQAATAGGYASASKRFGSTKEAVQTFVVMFASSVVNFMRHVNAVAESPERLLQEVEGIKQAAFRSLYGVRTVDDFNHWQSQVGSYLPSQPVRLKPSSTIDTLFGD
jgi:hypothetical protein